MINGTAGIVILVMFIVVLLLGGTLMSYLAERIERHAKQLRLEQKRTQQTEKPEEKRRAA